MRKLLSTLVLSALVGLPAAAEVPAGAPRVSPMATVSQVVGVAEVSVTYSRPSVRERTVWGELVPYGEVWRTGANEATTITFSHDAKVAGKPLAAGTYALFTIPGEDGWSVVFNKEAEQWGAFQYKAEQDALRVAATLAAVPFQETFEVRFPEVTADAAVVSLSWDKQDVRFPVQFDMDAVIVSKARADVAKLSGDPNGGRAIWNWANYFYQQETNTEEALGWATQLVGVADIYWTHALHARLLAQSGKAAQAIEAASKAMAHAESGEAGPQQAGIDNDAKSLKTQLAQWRSES